MTPRLIAHPSRPLLAANREHAGPADIERYEREVLAQLACYSVCESK